MTRGPALSPQVRLDEPLHGMTVEETKRLGLLHLQKTKRRLAFIRFSKPLLRLLLQPGPWAATPASNAQDRLAQSLFSLLKTCCDYHGDVEEAVQLLSLATARAAYVLLTPASRPVLASLEDLRPGARALGTGVQREALKSLAKTLREEALAVDEATAEELAEYTKTEESLAKCRTPRDMSLPENKNLLSDAFQDRKFASSAYIQARLDAYMKTIAYALNSQGHQPLSLKLGSRDVMKVVRRESAGRLTRAKATGVNAWMCFGRKLYAMQCKGQETGADAGQAGGQAGGDDCFSPKDAGEVLDQFAACLKMHGADFKNVAALELFSTQRMTQVSKNKVKGSKRAVVVVARDVLPSALGLVWGNIAARCMDVRQAGSVCTAGNASGHAGARAGAPRREAAPNPARDEVV